MKRSFYLVVALATSSACNYALGQTAGQTFAANCENGGYTTEGALPLDIGALCVGAGQIDGVTVGRTTFNSPLSPVDNNGPGTVATASKNSSLDLVEDRRSASLKDGSTERRDDENLQFSKLLGNINIFANIYRISGDRKNELIATERVGSTNLGQDGLNDPDTYIRPDVRSLGFSYDMENINAGFDYRLNKNLLAGLVLAHNKRNTDQIDSPGFSKYKDTQLSLLISYAADNGFYLDGVVGYGHGRQRYGREFSFSLNEVYHDRCPPYEEQEDDASCVYEPQGVTMSPLVLASTDSQNWTWAASTGFEIAMGRSSLTPFIRLESSTQTLDEYRESAEMTSNERLRFIEELFTGAFLLRVQQHKIESRTAILGLDYNHHFSTGFGVVSPKISIASVYQLKDPDPIHASFFFYEERSFSTETPSMDDHYLNLGFSTTFTMPSGLMFYALAEKMLDHKQLDQWGWALGFRKEL